MQVHQACYGVLKVPKGHWCCRPCRTNSKDVVRIVAYKKYWEVFECFFFLEKRNCHADGLCAYVMSLSICADA